MMMMMMMMMRASSDASYATQGASWGWCFFCNIGELHAHACLCEFYIHDCICVYMVSHLLLLFAFVWPSVSALCKMCVCVYQCMYFAFLLFKLSSCRHVRCNCISINKLHLDLYQNYCSSYPLW
jgi:hypothetical protein